MHLNVIFTFNNLKIKGTFETHHHKRWLCLVSVSYMMWILAKSVSPDVEETLK